MAHAIFFSYSRDDGEFVLKLAQELRAAGASIWLDQLDIAGGERWDRAIEQALESSPTMILVLSPSAVASDNVMDEVSYALEEGKQVIPVLCRECEVPFRLRRVQRIDFVADYDSGFQALLSSLEGKQELQQAGSAPAEAPAVERPAATPAAAPAERTPVTDSTSPAAGGRPPAEKKGSPWRVSLGVLALVAAVVVSFAVKQNWMSGPGPLPKTVSIPEVTSEPIAAALERLSADGFETERIDEAHSGAIGRVLRTEPTAGTIASVGDTVTVIVSAGVVVPDVVSAPVRDAQQRIASAGLLTKRVEEASSRERGVVLRSDPPAGTTLALEATVSLVVATGFPLEPVFSATADSGAAPLSVYFEDATIGDVATRRWAFGDGKSSVEEAPVHEYPGPGRYSATLTVVDAAGEEFRTTQTVVVNESKPARIEPPTLTAVAISTLQNVPHALLGDCVSVTLSGSLSNVMGRSIRLVSIFEFTNYEGNRVPLIADSAELTFRDSSGGVATSTMEWTSTADTIDLADRDKTPQLEMLLPYDALNVGESTVPYTIHVHVQIFVDGVKLRSTGREEFRYEKFPLVSPPKVSGVGVSTAQNVMLGASGYGLRVQLEGTLSNVLGKRLQVSSHFEYLNPEGVQFPLFAGPLVPGYADDSGRLMTWTIEWASTANTIDLADRLQTPQLEMLLPYSAIYLPESSVPYTLYVYAKIYVDGVVVHQTGKTSFSHMKYPQVTAPSVSAPGVTISTTQNSPLGELGYGVAVSLRGSLNNVLGKQIQVIARFDYLDFTGQQVPLYASPIDFVYRDALGRVAAGVDFVATHDTVVLSELYLPYFALNLIAQPLVPVTYTIFTNAEIWVDGVLIHTTPYVSWLYTI